MLLSVSDQTEVAESKIALLSLLDGPRIPKLIEHLRATGEEGPTDADYRGLQKLGYAVIGPVTGALILTPQGRARAAGIAAAISQAAGGHQPVYGIRDGLAYFRCTCGVKLELPAKSHGAYRSVRSAYDRHYRQLEHGIELYRNARGTPEDAHQLLRERLRRQDESLNRRLAERGIGWGQRHG